MMVLPSALVHAVSQTAWGFEFAAILECLQPLSESIFNAV